MNLGRPSTMNGVNAVRSAQSAQQQSSPNPSAGAAGMQGSVPLAPQGAGMMGSAVAPRMRAVLYGTPIGPRQHSLTEQPTQFSKDWNNIAGSPTATPGSGVEPGLGGNTVPQGPAPEPFDPNDPNNAALAGYMAR